MDYLTDEMTKQFSIRKLVELENFLDPKLANVIADDMIAIHNAGEDFVTSFPRPKEQHFSGTPNTKEFEELNKKAFEMAIQAHKSKPFSRFYYRQKTENNENILKLKKIFNSSNIVDLFSKICGFEIELLYAEPFVYRKNSFLGIHVDSIKQDRVVATILHLSRDWEEDDGGLYLYTDENGQLQKYVPKFNSIIISDVRNEEFPHAVTKVKTDKHRLTIVAWWILKSKTGDL